MEINTDKFIKQDEIRDIINKNNHKQLENKIVKPDSKPNNYVYKNIRPEIKEKTIDIKKIYNEIKIDNLMKQEKKENINKSMESKNAIRINASVNNFLSSIYHNNEDKKRLLYNNIQNNDTIQSMINENVVYNAVEFLPNHYKFIINYGIELYNTESQYKYLVKQSEKIQEKKEE